MYTRFCHSIQSTPLAFSLIQGEGKVLAMPTMPPEDLAPNSFLISTVLLTSQLHILFPFLLFFFFFFCKCQKLVKFAIYAIYVGSDKRQCKTHKCCFSISASLIFVAHSYTHLRIRLLIPTVHTHTQTYTHIYTLLGF